MIDEATSVIPLETDDLTLFSLAGIKEGYLKLWTYNAEQSVGRQLPGLSKMSVANVMKKGVTEEFLKDALKSKLLIKHEDDIYFTPLWLSRDLGVRAGLQGDAIDSATPERSAYLMHRYVVDPESAFMVIRANTQDGGRVKKIIAMPSEKYRRIPQSILLDVIAYLQKEMGETKCVCWSIEHGITQIWIGFPEKAEDIAEIYKLPERMCELLCIEVPDPMAMVENIFKNCRIKKTTLGGHLGKRRVKALTEQLEAEINPVFSYTAYDIVMRMMKLPTQYKEDKNISIGLEELVSKIPFLNFNAFSGVSKRKSALIA